mmetsp:Transcript_33162/g.77123  ORF Transcript_33162/g.77123 Transcript_33162/m.77123 type:complete len:322 (+) Transcript_33162:2-967(+)
MVTAPLFEGMTFTHTIELKDESATKLAMQGTLRTGFAMLAQGCALQAAKAAKGIRYHEDGSLLFTDFASAAMISSDLQTMNHSDWHYWIELEPGKKLESTPENVIAHFFELLFAKVNSTVLNSEEISTIWGKAWEQQASDTKLFDVAKGIFLEKLKFKDVPLRTLVWKADVGRVRERVKDSSLEEKEDVVGDLLLEWKIPDDPELWGKLLPDDKTEELFGILLSSLGEEEQAIEETYSFMMFESLRDNLRKRGPLAESAGRMLEQLVRYESGKDPECERDWRNWGSEVSAMGSLKLWAPREFEVVKKIYKYRCKVEVWERS